MGAGWGDHGGDSLPLERAVARQLVGKYLRVRVALDAKTAHGTMGANSRSYDEVWFPWTTYSGGEFEFSKGRLTSFSFEEGGREFAQKYARGTAGKNRTGSLVIGLHPRLKNVVYTEEKERGAVQLTVGGNTYSGGNNASDFRGALCLPGAEISVDDSPVVRAGKVL
ncbi:MAG TPA: hypothetical protein VGX00_00320 [Thermoplasmata archaeon]|nr:hypothetical protein [Thermoplasmata archaeon]